MTRTSFTSIACLYFGTLKLFEILVLLVLQRIFTCVFLYSSRSSPKSIILDIGTTGTLVGFGGIHVVTIFLPTSPIRR